MEFQVDEVLILLSVGGDFVFFLFFPILTRHICMYHFIYFLMPPWTHTHTGLYFSNNN